MATLEVQQGDNSRFLSFCAPAPLCDVLEAGGFSVSHPCGRQGRCGKCGVELTGEVSAPNAAEQKAGMRLSCQAILLGDACVRLPDRQEMKQIELSGALPDTLRPMDGTLGAAVDIGTTTLALKLCCLRSGRILSEAAMRNPQAAVAADVMGRIGAAMDGRAALLRQQVTEAVKTLLQTACEKAERSPEEVDICVITGNTTMLYLLTGRDTACLAAAPFHADTLFGCFEELLDRRAYLPRCMDAFVGADITCAVVASGMCSGTGPSLLCDIGTNGELALWKDGKLYVTSTAAGPAFEGAGILWGCGSKVGAIDKVWVHDGRIRVHTIEDAPAAGICGSGLIDAVAALLQTGLIDETGAVDEDFLTLDGQVGLTPRDIRAVQLAKAAIAAGIATLLETAETSPEEIDAFYIAGGFGMHLDVRNAAAIGLIPYTLADRAVPIGNAALSGALHMLLNRDFVDAAQKIAAKAVPLNLGGNPRFNEHYMEQILF